MANVTDEGKPYHPQERAAIGQTHHHGMENMHQDGDVLPLLGSVQRRGPRSGFLQMSPPGPSAPLSKVFVCLLLLAYF